MARIDDEDKDYKSSGDGRRINDLNSYITNVSKASDSVIISQKKLIASQAGTISAFKISSMKMNKMLDDVGMASKNMMVGTANFTRQSLKDFKRSLQEEFNVNKPNMLGMTVAKAFGPLVGFMATKFAQSGIYENLKEKISENWSDWKEKRSRGKREKVERYVDAGMEGGVHIPKMRKGGITTRDTKAQLHKNEAVVPIDKYFTYKGQSVFKRIAEDLDQIKIGTIQQTGKMKMFFGNMFDKNPLFRRLYKTYYTLSTILTAPRKLIGLLFKPRGGYIRDLPKRGSASDQTVAILGMIYTTGMTKLDGIIYYLKAMATKAVPGLTPFKDKSGEDTMYSRIMASKGKSIIDKIKILTGQSTTKGFIMEMKMLAGYAKKMGLKDQFYEAGNEAKSRIKKLFSKEGLKELGGNINTRSIAAKEGSAEEKKTVFGRMTSLLRSIGKSQKETEEASKATIKGWGQTAADRLRTWLQKRNDKKEAERKERIYKRKNTWIERINKAKEMITVDYWKKKSAEWNMKVDEWKWRKEEKKLLKQSQKQNKKLLSVQLKEAAAAKKEKRKNLSLLERIADDMDEVAKSTKKGFFSKLFSYFLIGVKGIMGFITAKFLAPFKLIAVGFKTLSPIIKTLFEQVFGKGGVGTTAEAAADAAGGITGTRRGRRGRIGKGLAKIGAGVAGGLMLAEGSYEGYKNKDQWGTSGTGAAIGGALGGSEGGTQGAISGIAKGAAIGMMFGPIGAGIGALVGGVLGFIGGKKIAKAWDWLGDKLKDLGKISMKVITWPIDKLRGMFDSIFELWDSTGESISKAWDSIKEMPMKFAKVIGDSINSMNKKIKFLRDMITDFMIGMISGIAKWLLETITSIMPGGDYIKKTSMYENAIKFLDGLNRNTSQAADIIPPSTSTSDVAKIQTAPGILAAQGSAGENRKSLSEHAANINNGTKQVQVAVTNLTQETRNNQESNTQVNSNSGGAPGQHDPGIGSLIYGGSAVQ